MIRQQGFTLIEIIAFIIVVGIIATGILLAFNTVLFHSSEPGKLLQANQLAHARMQLILQQRLINGFDNLSDPCETMPSLTPCQTLATFADNNGLNVSSSITGDSTAKTVTISVRGAGSSRVVTRFVP